MFICGRCKKPSKAGDRATVVVTQRREREYTDPKDESRKTKGWEIAKEIKVCAGCILQ